MSEQQQEKQSRDGSGNEEGYQHNSLLNPLPSYIGRSISTSTSEHSADDSLPVRISLCFYSDDGIFLGSQHHSSARSSLHTARHRHSHTELYPFLSLPCSPCCWNRTRSLSHRRGRVVCLGRRIQRAAGSWSLCAGMRSTAQRTVLACFLIRFCRSTR